MPVCLSWWNERRRKKESSLQWTKKRKNQKKSQKDEMVVVHSDLDYRAMTNDDGRKMLWWWYGGNEGKKKGWEWKKRHNFLAIEREKEWKKSRLCMRKSDWYAKIRCTGRMYFHTKRKRTRDKGGRKPPNLVEKPKKGERKREKEEKKIIM